MMAKKKEMESKRNVEKVQIRIELKAIEEEKVDLEKERLQLMANVVSTTKHEHELKIMFMDTSCLDDT